MDKSRKTALVQFENLVQLRRSLAPRIKERLKDGSDSFLQEIAAHMSKLKAEARKDLESMEAKLFHGGSGRALEMPEGSKPKPGKASKKNPDEATTVAASVAEPESDCHSAGNSKEESDDDEDLVKRPTCVHDDDKDDDLFSARRFQRSLEQAVDVAHAQPALSERPVADAGLASAAPEPEPLPAVSGAATISDEMKEMLSDFLSESALQLHFFLEGFAVEIESGIPQIA